MYAIHSQKVFTQESDDNDSTTHIRQQKRTSSIPPQTRTERSYHNSFTKEASNKARLQMNVTENLSNTRKQ